MERLRASTRALRSCAKLRQLYLDGGWRAIVIVVAPGVCKVNDLTSKKRAWSDIHANTQRVHAQQHVCRRIYGGLSANDNARGAAMRDVRYAAAKR